MKQKDLFKNDAKYNFLQAARYSKRRWKDQNWRDIFFQDFQEANMSSENEELIIDTYFIHKINVREITSWFVVSRSKVY